jgi:hypothetical protein
LLTGWRIAFDCVALRNAPCTAPDAQLQWRERKPFTYHIVPPPINPNARAAAPNSAEPPPPSTTKRADFRERSCSPSRKASSPRLAGFSPGPVDVARSPGEWLELLPFNYLEHQDTDWMEPPRFSPAGSGQYAMAEDRPGQQDRPRGLRSPSIERTPSPLFAGIDFSIYSPLLDDSPDNAHRFMDEMMALDYPSQACTPASSAGFPVSPCTLAPSGMSGPLPFARKGPTPKLPRLDPDEVEAFFAATLGPASENGRAVVRAAALLRQAGQWNFPHADTLFGLTFDLLARHFSMRFEVERQREAGAPGYCLQFGDSPAPYAGRLILRGGHYGVKLGERLYDVPADGDCAFHALNLLVLHRQGNDLGGYLGQTRPDGMTALRVAPGDGPVDAQIGQLRALAADDLTRRAEEIGAWLEASARPVYTPGEPIRERAEIAAEPVGRVPVGPIGFNRERSDCAVPYPSASPRSSHTTITRKSRRSGQTALASPEHINLVKNLPEELSPPYRSNINRLLIHLEERGLSWSQLVPAGSGPDARHSELEQTVNEGIRQNALHPGTRAAISRAFGFGIRGESGRVLLVPALQAHLDLLTVLPEGLSQPHRSAINRLLVHLEEQGLSWLQLVPADSGQGSRPPALEQVVNEGIRHHGLHHATRVAINRAFGLTIRGGSRPITLPPVLQAHTDLMKALPKDLGQQYRSHINRLLVHLEDERLSWPQLVPAGSSLGASLPVLEQAVNEGIRHHGLHPATRVAIKRAFGFTIQTRSAKGRLAPALQAHIELMKALPEGLGPQRRSDINQLLVHLEKQGLSWSLLVPANSGPNARPPALEQAVDEGIRHHGLPSATRSAIHRAFGFPIRAKSRAARSAMRD